MYMAKNQQQVSSYFKLNIRAANGILAFLLLASSPFISFSQKKAAPFIIHSTSAHVKSVEIKAKKSADNTVTINLSSENAGSAYSETPEGNNAKWAIIPTPQITNITVMEGFYSALQKINESNRSNNTLLTQVTFPIRLKVEISDQKFDVQILQPGSWTIKVVLDNIFNPDLFNAPVN
jgi:hypothetical protein